MEVRIKEGNGYVDAEWTIKDGVMVVSPKEVKFEPKDGDEIWAPLYVCGCGYFKLIKAPYSYDGCKELLKKGWVFQTKEECQEFCNRLNEAINSVKP